MIISVECGAEECGANFHAVGIAPFLKKSMVDSSGARGVGHPNEPVCLVVERYFEVKYMANAICINLIAVYSIN